MKVVKFGGSSVSDYNNIRQVKKIITNDQERKVIVFSACGKRTSSDYKITDLLYLIQAHLKYGVSFDNLFLIIKNRFLDIEKALKLETNLEQELTSLYQKLNSEIDTDYLVSRGEYFTSKLLAAYLGYKFVDAKEVIKFNYDKTLNYELIEKLISEQYKKYKRLVIPGFYGSYDNGNIKLMPRGGSDITGSIIAKVLQASAYENYTDVSGILMADPNIIDNPKQIEVITYDELRELSYMGAKVIHEDAISPVKDANIPIYILNTFDPKFKGTKIVQKVAEGANKNVITGISGKKGFTSITIYKSNASNEVGVLAKAFEIFKKYDLKIEQTPSGIDNFSIIVSTKAVQKNIYELIAELKEKLACDRIKIENNLSLIAIVGRNMAHNIGASGKIFKTLGDHKINIRMIIQGSDEINIVIGVDNKDFEKTIKVLYKVFS